MLAILRLLKTFVRAARLPTLHPHDTCITRWRVLPGDIDAFGHMNNARYPALAGRPLAPPPGAEEVRRIFGPAALQGETNRPTVRENPAVHAPP